MSLSFHRTTALVFFFVWPVVISKQLQRMYTYVCVCACVWLCVAVCIRVCVASCTSLTPIDISSYGSPQFAGSIRDPRHTDPDGRVLPYSWHKAMGKRFMRENFSGRFADHGYIAHVAEEVGSGTVRMIFVQRLSVVIVHAEGKGHLKGKRVEKEIESSRLEGLKVRSGVGIELCCSGGSAFVVQCCQRNVDRLVNLMGELIALHQRYRRLRVVTGTRCFFAIDQVEVDSRATDSVTPTRDSTRPTVVMREVWENQRLYPWVGFSPKLLPTDLSGWSSYDGKTGFSELNVIRPSPGWRWIDQWTVDTSQGADPDGWIFATDFPAKTLFVSKYNKLKHFVRRRRWIRKQESLEAIV